MTGTEGNDADPKVAYGINPQGGQMMPFDQETGETLALGHGGGVCEVVGFKAGQSANGGLGDEREVSPTLTHQPSTLEPTMAQANLSPMRYIVRRLTPTECERLMGLPDGYTVPKGLDPNDPALVAEFQSVFDTFGAIMAEYEHTKPPKPKSANQVAAWLAKVADPATCPDSPRYKACGNGWATNQPRWILCRMLAADGIDPFERSAI
jgi:site-specific DNA-cytosine methylase